MPCIASTTAIGAVRTGPRREPSSVVAAAAAAAGSLVDVLRRPRPRDSSSTWALRCPSVVVRHPRYVVPVGLEEDFADGGVGIGQFDGGRRHHCCRVNCPYAPLRRSGTEKIQVENLPVKVGNLPRGVEKKLILNL